MNEVVASYDMVAPPEIDDSNSEDDTLEISVGIDDEDEDSSSNSQV